MLRFLPRIVINLLLLTFYLFLAKACWYGSFSRDCLYSEYSLPAPEQLEAGTLTLVNDAFLVFGSRPPSSCLSSTPQLAPQIISAQTMDRHETGHPSLPDKGIAVMPLEKGRKFTLVGASAAIRHGVAALNLGCGPVYSLVLKDNAGNRYRVNTSELGNDNDGLLMAFHDAHLAQTPAFYRFLTNNSFIASRSCTSPYLIFNDKLYAFQELILQP